MKYKYILPLFAGIILCFSLYFASWYVQNGDLHFPSDIARDFLLLNEIGEKKIILIGERMSFSGWFHGPLWLYVNFPAYLAGNGNPIVVGWYWIGLTILALGVGFWVAKKLFDKNTAYIYIILLSLVYVFHAHEFSNPHGAMLIMPLFFYCFVRYVQTKTLRWIIFLSLLVGCLIQFELAIGGPFLVLTVCMVTHSTIKQKKYKHIILFLFLALLTMSSYIIFDVRHEFLFFKRLIGFSFQQTNLTYISLVSNRISSMFAWTSFVRVDPGSLNLLLFLLLLTFIALQIKNKQKISIYFSFLYLYFGFFVLSLLNRGGFLLSFHTYPLIPLILLPFASIIETKYKKIFLLVVVFICFLNIRTILSDSYSAKQEIFGKSKESWKFLNKMTKQAFMQMNNNDGYFVYSPDALAYPIKYATYFAKTTYAKNKMIYYFKKMPTTYVFYEPSPANDPYMTDEFWKKSQLRIQNKPVGIVKYPNGYRVEKYLLTKNETSIPFDPNIDTGIHFR